MEQLTSFAFQKYAQLVSARSLFRCSQQLNRLASLAAQDIIKFNTLFKGVEKKKEFFFPHRRNKK